MKISRFFILSFVLILICSVNFASDEVYLDLNMPELHRFNTGELQYENRKINDEDAEDYLKPSFQTMKKMFDEDFREDKTESQLKYKLFKDDRKNLNSGAG